jgi:hypothetical protein
MVLFGWFIGGLVHWWGFCLSGVVVRGTAMKLNRWNISPHGEDEKYPHMHGDGEIICFGTERRRLK